MTREVKIKRLEKVYDKLIKWFAETKLQKLIFIFLEIQCKKLPNAEMYGSKKP